VLYGKVCCPDAEFILPTQRFGMCQQIHYHKHLELGSVVEWWCRGTDLWWVSLISETHYHIFYFLGFIIDILAFFLFCFALFCFVLFCCEDSDLTHVSSPVTADVFVFLKQSCWNVLEIIFILIFTFTGTFQYYFGVSVIMFRSWVKISITLYLFIFSFSCISWTVTKSTFFLYVSTFSPMWMSSASCQMTTFLCLFFFLLHALKCLTYTKSLCSVYYLHTINLL